MQPEARNRTQSIAFTRKPLKTTAKGKRWGVLHDGNVEGDYETKEAAFEAAIAAA